MLRPDRSANQVDHRERSCLEGCGFGVQRSSIHRSGVRRKARPGGGDGSSTGLVTNIAFGTLSFTYIEPGCNNVDKLVSYPKQLASDGQNFSKFFSWNLKLTPTHSVFVQNCPWVFLEAEIFWVFKALIFFETGIKRACFSDHICILSHAPAAHRHRHPVQVEAEGFCREQDRCPTRVRHAASRSDPTCLLPSVYGNHYCEKLL